MTYDIVIVGGGAAGLTAGIYGSRARLTTLLVEKNYPGGQVMMCENIENFPGFAKGTCGMDLATGMREQAERFGMETVLAEVDRVDLKSLEKVVHTVDGREIRGKTVVLCLGASPRRLGVPGEAEMVGRGVSYCAVCDGAFFQDKRIAVVGGGDTAVEDSVFLTRYASQVDIYHRRNEFRAQRIIQERALSNPKIRVNWSSVIREIGGSPMVEYHRRGAPSDRRSEEDAGGRCIRAHRSGPEHEDDRGSGRARRSGLHSNR